MVIKTNIFAASILVFVILSISCVFAFGVSSPYWKDNPLMLYPGGSSVVEINYQNMNSAEDINVNAEITKGREIASLGKSDYLVKKGTKDTAVLIEIKIPDNAVIGSIYTVTLTSKTVTPGATGGVSFGLGMDTTFDVKIIQEPTAEPLAEEEKAELPETKFSFGTLILAILGILAIVIIIFMLYKKKK
jgi:hypothetical protein